MPSKIKSVKESMCDKIMVRSLFATGMNLGAKQLVCAMLLLAAMASVARSQTASLPIAGVRTGVSPATPGYGAPFYASQFRSAYGVTGLPSSAQGAGQTIAIVDAYDYPNALSALNTYSTTMGLPQMTSTSFLQLNQSGGTALPGVDPAGSISSGASDNWELEEALDIEMVHAMAPQANIILYEANSSAFSDLLTAVNTAKTNSAVAVVSMSFGSSEFSGEKYYDSIFTTPASRLAVYPKQGVTFIASTGDSGAPGEYPAYSPNVVAVGGTNLYVTSSDAYSSESAWGTVAGATGGGGGISTKEPKPSYQNTSAWGSVLANSSSRSIPDVSMVASNTTPVETYDPYNGGYFNVYGTSVATPLWAGLVADADGIRTANGYGTLDGPGQTLPALYSLPSTDYHDVTSGSNGFSAGPGFDLATGLGTPVANSLVPDLAAYQTSRVLGNWTSAGGGSWSTSGNWDSNGAPGNTNQDTAIFGTTIGSSSATITLDGSRALSSLTFSTTGGGSYTLSRASSDSTSVLILVSTGTTTAVVNNGGSHAINAPVVLGSNLNMSAASGTKLTINGQVSETGGSHSLTVSGGGLFVLAGTNSYSGGTTVSGGMLQASTTAALPGYGTSGQVAVGNGATLAVNVGGNGQWAATAIDTLRSNASFASGAALGIDTTNATNGFTYASSISGNLGLVKLGANTLTLTGADSYGGGTTINAGRLVAGAVNSLSANSALTINGGTLDVSGFANPVASLNIASSGSLNLGLGNTLTSSGTAALNGALNVSGTGTLGNYQLLTYASETGTFANVTGIGSNYGLLYNSDGTELDALHKAQVGTFTASAVYPTVITGGSTALTVNVNNSAPASSDALNFTASARGAGYASSASGNVAAANSGSFTIAGGFNSSTLVPGSYTGTITVTGTNSVLAGAALNSGGTQSVVVTVLGHASPSLNLNSGNNQTVIVGASGVTAGLTLSNGTLNQGGLVSLDVNSLGSLVAGWTGSKLVASGLTQSYTGTLGTGTLGTQTETFSLNVGDDHTLPGASSATNVSASATLTVLGHAIPSIAISQPGNVIVGATGIVANLSLSNGSANQSGLASLDVNSLGTGVSGGTGGAWIASGLSKSYSAALNTSTLGTNNQVFSLNAGDDHTLPGASAATNLSATATLTVYDHSNASLSPTAVQTTQTINFGNFLKGAAAPASQNFTIYNLAANTSAQYTANMKMTGFATSGDTASIQTNLANFSGLSAGYPLAGGSSNGVTYTASLNTNSITTGIQTISIAANQLVDDSSLPGVGNNNSGGLTITLEANVGNAAADNSNSQAAFGPAMTAHVAQGASYANLASTVTSTTGSGGRGMVGSTASILGGTASGPANVSMAWRTSVAQPGGANESFVSDVVDLSGITVVDGQTHDGSVHTDTFALEMSYDPAAVTARTGLSELAAAEAGDIVMDYLDLGSSGLADGAGSQWEPAVAGNFGSTNEHFVGVGAWDGDMTLGDYGVDVDTHTVWAVVNHNSQFAVVPEPSALVLLAAGAVGLVTLRLRRPRKGRLAMAPVVTEEEDSPAILSFPSRRLHQSEAARRAA